MGLQKYFDKYINELNQTANLDGGEGPMRTPGAFAETDGTESEKESDHNAIELLGYKKTKKTNVHFETTYGKLASEMHLLEN